MRFLRLAGRLWIGVLLVAALIPLLLIGVWRVLPLQAEPARLLSATPADGASGVSSRSVVTLRFSTPMNWRAFEQSLLVTPPVQATLIWDATYTTVTISPTASLRADTHYRIKMGEQAISRMLRPLERPVELHFQTAPAPAIVATFPSGDQPVAPSSTSISVKFSRPMVPPEALMRPLDFPELSFAPLIPGRAIWLDQRTLLFQPDAPLRPNTNYQATLSPGLEDLSGSQSERPYRWNFRTAAPVALSVAPSAGDHMVAPSAPLVVHISQPIEEAAIRSGLVITPALAGTLETAILPDQTQVITYTPAPGWRSGIAYSVELRGVTRAASTSPESLRWSFTTALPPALVGRFPGEGQLLPPGQAIRLVFSTPIDARTLRETMRFSPPITTTHVTVSGMEVRISVDARPATAYTLTLPASLADFNGVQLGQEYRIRFQTAPAAPALLLPDMADHIALVAPDPAPALRIRRTNLSGLNFDLYRLDEATIIRTLAFRESDWSDFQPERYAQPLLRSWLMPLNDPLNDSIEDRQLLADADGRPLAPGTYYLRIRTPDGPRADVVLLVSRIRISFYATTGLIRATDVVSGTAPGDLPVAIYQDGALIREGTTGSDGLWWALPGGADPARSYVVLARGAQPSVARADWRRFGIAPPTPQYTATLVTNQPEYQPGATVMLAGFVRQEPGNAAPGSIPQVRLEARRTDNQILIFADQQTITSAGVISSSFRLAASTLPGTYLLTMRVGEIVAQVPFRVQPLVDLPLAVTVRTPAILAAGDPGAALITARSREGLPVAGAVISWTLSGVPVPFPQLPEYTLGDEELPPAQPRIQNGIGQADREGRFSVVLSDTAALEQPLRYRLIAEAFELAGPHAIGETGFLAPPAHTYIGVRLTSRLVLATQPVTIEIRTVMYDGQPRPTIPVRVEVYRRDSATGALDTPVLSRDLITGNDGNGALPIQLPAAGEYRVRVRTADTGTRQMYSAVSLWVAAPGFSEWRPDLAGKPALITDQQIYRPGDTATLLLTIPFSQTAPLLLSTADMITSTLQTIRVGEPFTVTLPISLTEDVYASLLLNRPAGGDHILPDIITARLPLRRDNRLMLNISSDQQEYRPGEIATLTISSVGADGRSRPAQLMVGIAGRSMVYWNTSLNSGPAGRLRLKVQLPNTPGRLNVVVQAAAGHEIGLARMELLVLQPLTLELAAPAFLRAGDTTDVVASIENTGVVSQQIDLALAVEGEPLSTGALRQIVLAPGEQARVAWQIQAGNGPIGRVQVNAWIAGATPLIRMAHWKILLPAAFEIAAGSSAVEDRYTANVTIPERLNGGILEIDLAPSTRALALTYARNLADLPGRATLDEAGLLMISSALTETHDLAVDSLSRLIAAQNIDGGWGWSPGTRTQPFATIVVLDALAHARQSDLEVPENTINRAIITMRVMRNNAAVSANLRATMLYAQALFEPIDPPVLSKIAADPAIGADGLALLLLAGTPEPEALLERLELLALQEQGIAHWAASADGATFCDDVCVTAIVVRAFEQARPQDPLIPAARRWLATTRSVDGWPDAYTGAQALEALQMRATLPYTQNLALSLNGTAVQIQQPGEPITTTRRLVVPFAELQARNTLETRSSGAEALIAYRVVSGEPQMPLHDTEVGLWREYIDPHTGRPIDPRQMVAGQPVLVQLTVVVPTAQSFVRIEDPLPAGMALIDTPAPSGFDYVANAADRLVLQSARLRPGAYIYRYLIRAVHSGRYMAAPPIARGHMGRQLGAGNTAVIEIIRGR